MSEVRWTVGGISLIALGGDGSGLGLFQKEI